MTPSEFIQKWRASNLKERSAAQSHFNDLCALLGEATPAEADPQGNWYTFEKGASKTGGGEGWADVWKRNCFAWEYKGKHANLDSAFAQLQRYAIALENPPLLVVSDMETIRIHTNFTNTVHEVRDIRLEDLEREDKRRILKWVFTDPDQLKPGTTRQQVTEIAAARFAELAKRLHARGYEPQRVAHFVNKLVFCMFAEDIGILPTALFSRLLDACTRMPGQFPRLAADLFTAMKDGGNFGADFIDWFNGGLFSDADVLPLELDEIRQVRDACRLDWSAIEPSIFGTLFERGLDPDKRSQLGAHYTDRQSILRIVQPVVIEPLIAEWEQTKGEIAALLEQSRRAKAKSAATRHHKAAEQKYKDFLARLRDYRVLDPACGSGNFLYLALHGLKDIAHHVAFDGQQFGFSAALQMIVDPSNVLGIEINRYAAELARLTVWIGEIQWMMQHGFNLSRKPILKPLDQIACRDALLNDDGTEAAWPAADCIVSNPPFLGDRKMIRELGEDFVSKLRRTYEGRVPGGADLVTYWFEKARAQIEAGSSKRAGLVATNSIRGGLNRHVLDQVCEGMRIFQAWSDEPWILDGAAVRVSLVCFGERSDKHLGQPQLNGVAVPIIYADLAGGHTANLLAARPLQSNARISFIGTQRNGPFTIPGAQARQWLVLPANPNGRSNRDVLRPWANADDIVKKRPSDTWIIDFGPYASQSEAALYEAPFEHVVRFVRPTRIGLRRKHHRERWWLFGDARPGLRKGIEPLERFIATPMVSKHRIFVWLPKLQIPENLVVAVAREDETTFGILHSRFHEAWALRLCTWLGVGNDPRYTPSTTFETYPFPEGLTPDIPAAQQADDPRAEAIAAPARNLNQLRECWLNPPDLVRRVPEVVPGYPDRILPIDERAAKELKKRTLTNLYNQKPAWLAQAHAELDAAVAAAYGWPADIPTDEALARLLKLNLSRAGAT